MATTRCSNCSAEFECGAETGDCWCTALPALESQPSGRAACLCPECLHALLEREHAPQKRG